MRVLLNATTPKSGGFQRAINFLTFAISQSPPTDAWHFAVSPEIDRAVRLRGDVPEDRWHVLAGSPARSLKLRRELRQLANRLRPDGVYTFAGPAYVKFSQPHLMGFYQAWLSNPNPFAARSIVNRWEKFKLKLWLRYARRWFARADAWISQTEAARQGMHRQLGYPLEKISVVGNSCSVQYLNLTSAGDTPFPAAGQRIRALYFCAPYVHKGLEMVPRMLAEVKRHRPDLPVDVVLTLPGKNPVTRAVWRLAEELGVADRIENLGPIAPADGPALYRRCHFAFVPTLLETFTANYPEAMAMGLPIVTSDLDFATTVCGDAALYFAPNDPASAAEQIQRLLSSPALWQTQIAQGKQAVARLPDLPQQFAHVCAALSRMVADSK